MYHIMPSGQIQILLLLLLLSLQSVSSDCPLIYQMLDKDHSYCATKTSVRSLSPTSKEVELILEMHNDERLEVNSKEMQKMYWNDDLAEIAQRYGRILLKVIVGEGNHFLLADHCDYHQDKPHQRQAPRIPIPTGQNLAMGYENWTLTIQGWIDEKYDFVYGSKTQRGVVGNYTQMMKDTAVLIGCGSAICPNSSVVPHNEWPHYVCNYVTGQLDDNRPYKSPGPFRSNSKELLDCHGLLCLYNGILDLRSCQCKCEPYANGEQCENLNCSTLSDTCDYGDDKSLCTIYSNVPLACPKFCGLCEQYDETRKYYQSLDFVPVIRIQTVKNTQSISSLGNLSQSSVFIQLIIVPFVLFLIK